MQSSQKEKHDRSKFNAIHEHTISPHYLLKELSSHQLHVLIASVNTQPDGETLLYINARKEILQKKGQCFNCLRAGHVVRVCASQHNNCLKCRQRHHTSLCQNKENPLTQNEKKIPRRAENKEPNNDHASEQTTCTSMFVNSHIAVLLQTAQTYICRPDDETETRNVRVFSYFCKQRGFMTGRDQLSIYAYVLSDTIIY